MISLWWFDMFFRFVVGRGILRFVFIEFCLSVGGSFLCDVGVVLLFCSELFVFLKLMFVLMFVVGNWVRCCCGDFLVWLLFWFGEFWFSEVDVCWNIGGDLWFWSWRFILRKIVLMICKEGVIWGVIGFCWVKIEYFDYCLWLFGEVI